MQVKFKSCQFHKQVKAQIT